MKQYIYEKNKILGPTGTFLKIKLNPSNSKEKIIKQVYLNIVRVYCTKYFLFNEKAVLSLAIFGPDWSGKLEITETTGIGEKLIRRFLVNNLNTFYGKKYADTNGGDFVVRVKISV